MRRLAPPLLITILALAATVLALQLGETHAPRPHAIGTPASYFPATATPASFAPRVRFSAKAALRDPVLRTGARGPKVKELQWLLGQHRPSAFHEQKKPTFRWQPNGLFGKRTATAIVQLKYRLGYPQPLVQPIAGPYLFALLLGQKQRPAAWVITATRRANTITPGVTKLGLKIRALELDQLGVQEYPLGSNTGYLGNGKPDSGSVYKYQRATGAIGAAWCVSFQQWSFESSGAGLFANATASVYAAVDDAQAHGYLRDKPKLGSLVAFIEYDRYGHRVPGTGHMGYVVHVTAHGFSSVEGNASNRVLERYHAIGERPMVFINYPRVAGA